MKIKSKIMHKTSSITLFILMLFVNMYSKEFAFTKIKSENLPSTIQRPNGKILELIEWRDKNGRNLLIIYKKDNGVVLEKGYSTKLFAMQYTESVENYKLIWKIQDFNFSDSEIEYAENSIKVFDIDGDSIAESSFAYTIASSERQTIKLLLHTKGTKLAIRGYYQVGVEYENPITDSIVFDKSFNNFKNDFRTYAQKEWDRLTKE